MNFDQVIAVGRTANVSKEDGVNCVAAEAVPLTKNAVDTTSRVKTYVETLRIDHRSTRTAAPLSSAFANDVTERPKGFVNRGRIGE